MSKIIDLPVPVKNDVKSKSNIPVVLVPEDAVARYHEACATIAEAEKVVERLKPELVDIGIGEVFAHNRQHAADAKAIISSVNLKDVKTEKVVQFSWTRKNLKFNQTSLETAFKSLCKANGTRANINDCVGYELAASFDCKVFFVDGKFNQKRYDLFTKAIAEVAAGLAVDNPLALGKVLSVKPDFHDRRWLDYDLETNLELQALVPTAVSLKPLAGEA